VTRGAEIALLRIMARISIIRAGDRSRITLKGRLAAIDLKRLERACGSALHEKVVPLELDIRGVTSIDQASIAYLDRLRARGARVRDLGTKH
jgi:translation initiation factor IF-2